MANVSIRMDDITKSQFESFCNDVGLSVSAAFNLFAKKVVREQRIPFEISNNDPFYSEENQKILLKSIQQLKDGKGTIHELIEVE